MRRKLYSYYKLEVLILKCHKCCFNVIIELWFLRSKTSHNVGEYYFGFGWFVSIPVSVCFMGNSDEVLTWDSD